MKKIGFYINGINFIIILIVLNLIVNFYSGLQIDLTSGKIHSLSTVSKETIKSLDDLVNIKVYLTKDLPADIKPIANDLKTVLSEIERQKPGLIKVKYYDPNENEEIKLEAAKYRIQALQFSSIKNDKFEVQNGYIGLVIIYGDRSQVLPMAGDVGNLEYFIISGIKKLTENNNHNLVIAEEKAGNSSEINYLKKFLSQNYSLSEINLINGDKLPEDADSLVIVGNNRKINDKTLGALNDWVKSGKSIISFIDKIAVNNLSGVKTEDSGLEKIYEEYGIKIENKLVWDESSAVANFKTESGNFPAQYKYWIQVRPEKINKSIPVLSGINNLSLAWASPVTISGSARELFRSSDKSGEDETMSNLSPMLVDRNPQYNGNKILGAINTDKVKLAVVADSDFIRDQYVVNNQQNLGMALNLIDYLSQDSDLFQIRSKKLTIYPLKDLDNRQKNLIKAGNLIAPLILLGLYALGAYWRRRKNNLKWNYED